MALTFPRWIALVAVGFGIALVALLREPEPRATSEVARAPAQSRADQAARHLTVAVERLRTLQLVDSVRNALGRAPTRQSRLAIAGNLQPQMRRAVEITVARLDSTRPTTPVVPVDLAFVLDTARAVRGVPRRGFDGYLLTDYVLPRPNSDDRCLVLARTKNLRESGRMLPTVYANILGGQSRSRLLGPCAFYERFGHPGPQIDRWLRGKAWSLGLQAERTASRPWTSRYLWGRSDEYVGLITNWRLRHAMSPRGFACAAGDIEACEGAILDPPTANRLVRQKARIWSTGIVSTGEGIELQRDDWWWITPRELGPRDWTVLAEIARTLGPDRFQQFWSSTQSPREAFRAAAGMDIGMWTHEWSRRMYGAQSRGPGLRVSSVLASVSFAIAALFVGVVAVRRRQVA